MDHKIAIVLSTWSSAAKFVLGKGWGVLFVHSSRRENVVSFDQETAIKRNLPIFSIINDLNLTQWTICVIDHT
jgi:hypothetical protein